MGELQLKISNFVEVRTLPNVLNFLIKEFHCKEATADSIADIISKDIALAARLLRVANSPFYRRGTEITTIDKAVSILGIRAVKALALSGSMFDIGSSASSPAINLNNFWRHSLEVAIISRNLAELIGGVMPEEAYACGLIHDLGILFFIQEFPEKYPRIIELVESGRTFEEAEIEVIGMSHSEAGAMIATAWRLPVIFYESIANHHRIDIHRLSGCPEIWMIINLAHRYCRDGIDVPHDITAEFINERDRLAISTGIDPAAANKVLADVTIQVMESSSFLDTDIGNTVVFLEHINEELGRLYDEYEEAIMENQYLHAKMVQQEKHKAALEALRTTLATFSHYVNNATAAIIGRAQILDLYLNQGKLEDPDGKIRQSVKIISESVDTICAVLDELKEFPEFKTVAYHGSSRILDIDRNIKARLGRLA